MAKNIELLRQEVAAMRNEVEDFANSAERVGGVVSDVLEYSHEEAERAKGAEQNLMTVVAQNAGEITALKGNSATKAELNAEAERAQSAEEMLTRQVDGNFDAFSNLGVSESAKSDGYEIALTKKTNTAEKTKVKVPVYDMLNPTKTPVGLVDEVFVEDVQHMIAEATDKKKDMVEVYSDTRVKPSSVFLNSSDGGWKLKNQYGEGLFFNVISTTGSDSNVAKIDTSGNMTIVGSLSQRSDETLKRVLSFVPKVTIDDIANAPVCYYHWKDVEDDVQHIGTLAQYWKNVVPECVRGEEGDMTMDYATLGLVSAVVNAREIVRLRKLLKEKGYDADEE